MICGPVTGPNAYTLFLHVYQSSVGKQYHGWSLSALRLGSARAIVVIKDHPFPSSIIKPQTTFYRTHLTVLATSHFPQIQLNKSAYDFGYKKMSTPRGRGRGRGGRSRGRGGNFFQQHESDGDLAMSDTSGQHNNYRGNDNNSFRGRGAPRGRGRGAFDHNNAERTEESNETVTLLQGFISRRYNADTKYFDLSNIVTDEPVKASGMFETAQRQEKFFPALMIVCDEMLPTRKAKIDAIDSISLAGNALSNLNVIYKLVNHMNHIKNLDLSRNAFQGLDKLKPWKGRFKFLEHLIIDPLPDMGWEEEITSWFPTLKLLNGKQVRPDNAPAQNGALQMPGVTNTPPPQSLAPQPVQQLAPQAPIMSEEDRKKEEMVAFVQQGSGLTRHYAIQCLEAGQWNLQQASDLFEQSRATLPPEAFGP